MNTLARNGIAPFLLICGAALLIHLGYRLFLYHYDRGFVTRGKDRDSAARVFAGLGTGLTFMLTGAVVIIACLGALTGVMQLRKSAIPAIQASGIPFHSSEPAAGNDDQPGMDRGEQVSLNPAAAVSSPLVQQAQPESRDALPPLEDSDEIDFLIARNLYDEGDYQTALEHFSVLAQYTASPDYRLRSTFYCGECCFYLGRLDRAILRYQEAIALNGRHELTSRAMLRQAQAFAGLGSFALANNLLQQLVEAYPASEERHLAAAMLEKY